MAAFACSFYPVTEKPESDDVTTPIAIDNFQNLYQKLNLGQLGLSYKAYQLGIKGWQKMKADGTVTKDVIAICDFSQSSTQKRLYVIDIVSGKLLFNTLVAHGRNTGEEFAQYFSNRPQSLMSSLGFYTTKQTYIGQHGLSLRLAGCEPGFNDKAEERAIVMHGADYANDNFISKCGKLGRSWGCPAVPYQFNDAIINAIKGGSCLFVYFPDTKYLASSKLLK